MQNGIYVKRSGDVSRDDDGDVDLDVDINVTVTVAVAAHPSMKQAP